jgi:hypothetical protein
VIPIAADDSALVTSLYQSEGKIYPRSVSGWFSRWRWTLVWATQLLFYGLPWTSVNGRQAVLFDLAARRFYIFNQVLYPQDLIYLTGLLIMSALALFLFTAVAGRLWCGYACPQTVYTEIFLWVERRIEGDRMQRMRLDQGPMSARKLLRKAAKHGVWAAIGLWTGLTFVGYFTPIRELMGQALTASLGAWEIFWVLFYGLATYGNAGWMREQVCKYMCPYARFQGAMFDRDTLIVWRRARPAAPRPGCGRLPGPWTGRLHRLRSVRAGVPDRHRHSQRPAVRVHQLLGLHRCVQHGDGQDALPARVDPLQHAQRPGQGPVGDADVAARGAPARAHLHGRAQPGHAGRAGLPAHPRSF